MKFVWSLYEVHTKFIRSLYEVHMKLLWSSYEVHISSYEVHTKFIQSSYKVHTKFIRSSYNFHKTFFYVRPDWLNLPLADTKDPFTEAKSGQISQQRQWMHLHRLPWATRRDANAVCPTVAGVLVDVVFCDKT